MATDPSRKTVKERSTGMYVGWANAGGATERGRLSRTIVETTRMRMRGRMAGVTSAIGPPEHKSFWWNSCWNARSISIPYDGCDKRYGNERFREDAARDRSFGRLDSV